MLRIAIVFAALEALATSQCPEAATPPSAPVSQPPGITVIDQSSVSSGLSEPAITFSKTLAITLTIRSNVDAKKCTVTDPTYQWATLQVVDPSGAKSDLGSVSNLDVYGGQDCNGRHSQTKSFQLAGAKGNYVLFLTVNTLVDRQPKGGPYFVYPGVSIEADGMAVVERSFPSYGGQAQITQVFSIVSK